LSTKAEKLREQRDKLCKQHEEVIRKIHSNNNTPSHDADLRSEARQLRAEIDRLTDEYNEVAPDDRKI